MVNEGCDRVQIADAGVWAESGRGLALVESLACAWGTEMTEGVRRVWFENDLGEESLDGAH